MYHIGKLLLEEDHGLPLAPSCNITYKHPYRRLKKVKLLQEYLPYYQLELPKDLLSQVVQ
jgi:hypothetical protein